MATPPSSRGSSLDHTFRPATPESTSVSRRSTTSMSVPKSEYLRHALEVRRAQNTPIQNASRLSAIDTQSQHLTAPMSPALHTPAASPDDFDAFDLPEEIMTPESPIRRRRPIDKDTPPRGKTNQELSAEVEKLGDELFKQKLRVELLRDSNHALQAKWLKAKEEVDQLKPLEDENYELRAENRKLTEKIAAVQDDMYYINEIREKIEELESEKQAANQANQALKQEVLNLTNINTEAVSNIQESEEALNEAVEMITALEGEKLHLKNEVDDLKNRVAMIESKQMDGSEYPQRIHSIDEQRPVTSYDDSDYYSQPATPRADVDRDAQSVRSGTSVRSKQFIELTKERTRSARSLSKRMSDVSLRATNLVSAEHVPQVPRISEEYVEITPRTVDERFRERRYRQDPGVEHLVARSGAEMRRPATVAPVPTKQSFALRSVYCPEQMQETSTLRPSTSYAPSPGPNPRPQIRARTQSAVEHYPAPPPRMSSRRAHTTNDEREYERLEFSDGTIDSNAASGTLVGYGEEKQQQEPKQEQVLTAWATVDPRTSTVSLLTSPRIDRPDKERWWKDTENVRPLRARATTRTLRTDCYLEDDGLGLATFAARAEAIRTNPVTPAAERPETDFLFNPRENEDQFMRKAIARLKGSMRR